MIRAFLKPIIGLCLAAFLTATVYAETIKGIELEQVLTSLQNLNASYISRCSNGGYEDSCLKDGRVHLVYELSVMTGEPLKPYDDKDLTRLLAAVRDGAEILVKESPLIEGAVGYIYECTAIYFGKEENKKSYAICSTNDFNFPKYINENDEQQKLWVSIDTEGNRFRRQINCNSKDDQKDQDSCKSVDTIIHSYKNFTGEEYWVKKYSWYVRY